ncbi:MAG TPA: DUF4912 domain-containing protein, partial [Pyrinomonadaceae bacterium]
TDLRDGLPRMTKRKTKRNAGRSRTHHGFKVCENPTVHLAGDGVLPDVDRIGVTHAHGQPFLFAIARDSRTIFASWNIDWRSVFEEEMPADRQVHLRIVGGDGILETTVAVEPMSAMHYVKTSGLHNAYRVEIGYFQPFDTWNSVAKSGDVEMPSQGCVELAEVDLATIPFHISFQQLANLLGTTNDASIARVVSEFQKRLINNGEPHEVTRSDRRILSSLNLSLDEIAAAERDFRKIHSEKPARHTRVTFQVGATSPTQGFQANPGL